MALSARVQPYANIDRRMREDLRHYCAKLVKIKGKAGDVRPFIWNEAQRQLDAKLEKQIDARGMVRAIILKARQLGVSTYFGARFYRRSTLWLGQSAFILTHEDKTTQQLFGMAKRIHDNMPADFRPTAVAANANELSFAGYDGGYRVGTAKNIAGTGRGFTFQLFHGSEVPLWAHAEDHFSGALQAVGAVPGTEVALEGTAQGPVGTFYDQWCLAEAKQSDFIAIFLPWMIEPTYARPVDDSFDPSVDEQEYQRLFKLSDEQLCWLHFKNLELDPSADGRISAKFKQEYPATAAEAFQSGSGNSFVPNEAILRARRLKVGDQSFLPRVLGVDVARNLGGGDQTRIVDRQGRRAGVIDEVLHTDNTVVVANRIMKILRDNPDIRKAYIDITGGLGAGPYDICRTNGFAQRVAGITFGAEAMDPERYFNKRAEMWGLMREWLLDPGGAQIPDDDEWHRHIAAPEEIPPDTNSRVKLEAKERIKKRLKFSPDVGDALGLTFAEILPVDMPDNRPKWMGDELEDDAGYDWQAGR